MKTRTEKQMKMRRKRRTNKQRTTREKKEKTRRKKIERGIGRIGSWGREREGSQQGKRDEEEKEGGKYETRDAGWAEIWRARSRCHGAKSVLWYERTHLRKCHHGGSDAWHRPCYWHSWRHRDTMTPHQAWVPDGGRRKSPPLWSSGTPARLETDGAGDKHGAGYGWRGETQY